MASSFLAVPLKRTWEVDLIKPLKTFITETYTGSDSDDFDQVLIEFNKLRNSTISKSMDKHESALEVLYRYSVCYLLALLNTSIYSGHTAAIACGRGEGLAVT